MPDIVVYSNLLPFIALIVLLFLIYRNPLFNHRQNRLFQIAVIITLIMLVCISVDYILVISTWSQAWVLRTFTTFLNFSMAPFVPLLLYSIFSSKKPPKWFYFPSIINLVLCLASIWMGIIFSISTENTYSRGSLFFAPFAISILYILILLYESRKHRQIGKRSESLFLIVVIALLLLGMTLEIVWAFKFLSWDVVAVSLVLYYLLLNINNSTTDPLTGALNRPMYTSALSKAISGNSFSIANLDINNFKRINDIQGHDAGDMCLKLFVSMIQDNLPKDFILYRVGGDEFAIISSKPQNQDLFTDLLEKLRLKTQTRDIDFSYGIATFNPGSNLENILYEADQAMYAYKQKIKETNNTIHNK